MKLILDSIIFSLQKQGGISIYWKELILRICNDAEYDIDLILYKNTNNNPNFNELRVKIPQKYNLSNFLKKNTFLTTFYRFFPKIIFRKKKTIFHSSYLNFAIGHNIKNVLTIHDMGYERNLTQFGIKKKINLFFKYFAIKNSDALICISQFTKDELIHFYPFCVKKPIKIIYNGKSSGFYPLKNNKQKIVDCDYVLFVGTRYSYKQFDLVVEALKVRTDLKLVIVGGGKFSKREASLIKNNLGNRYIHFQNVSTEDLNNLYNFSIALIYPSIYEGFGIPIIEAMSAGCPFIALNKSSIPEIACGAGIIIKNNTIEEIIEATRKLENHHIRERVIKIGYEVAEKYSWDKCYRETKDFYEEIYNK